MNYQQLIQPNLSVIGQPEMCLAYVRAVFGARVVYSTAAIAWKNAIYPHPGEQPPTSSSVPIWFSYNGPDGHVAVWHYGSIYSTSVQGDKTFSSINELINWMDEDFVYLGWSEDIDGLRVIEPVAASNPSRINLPTTSGAWHLYKPGGPYNPNNPSNYIAIVHPSYYVPEGLTYPIVQVIGNGIYRIQSPAHGTADLWTNGSEFKLS